MAAKKLKRKEVLANWFIVTLSVFIIVFTIFHDLLDIKSISIIFALTMLSSLGVYYTRRTKEVSNYILLPVIILDGFFHLTSPLENLVKNSPDWVIAFKLFGGNGMPVVIHQVMGMLLLITSGFYLNILIKDKKGWYFYFYKYVVTVVTVTIISLSYIIKISK